ncbi:Apoptosis-inducing factor 3 [Eumeta japonica]|uniref:Apoptosis-inducing factor 3 n=1 Tax=Eumeta variegata TaxID=151549 RepID=A0A4C1VQY7_EUMVA|nr:Apoptosis-inducing factor 3 [Eumeta japonica]
MESNENYVEQVVCNQNDLNDNEMKVFDIGEDQKVLVVKQKGEINAIGTKCTHYGAPLANGALSDGRIRCPWHGACFNIKTGDIEDFPGFDSLPCYQVTISKKGDVKCRIGRRGGVYRRAQPARAPTTPTLRLTAET